MPRPADLVAIPPLARTVIYYVLALANVVVAALVGYDRLEPLWLVIVSGVSGVFFGVAGSNVASKNGGPVVAPDVVLVPDQPLPPEDAPVDKPAGYMGGV